MPRLLASADLDEWVPKLAEMTYAERAELPGVSTGRAPAAARRRGGRRGGDGAARRRRGAGLPLGAARGHHPAPARLDARQPDRTRPRPDTAGLACSGRFGCPGRRSPCPPPPCYPETCTTAFEMAADLGFDGVEVMVWTDPVSQDPDALRGLSDRFGVPVLAIHAPCLLLTQRVWSTDPWTKLQRAQAAAERVGAADRRRAPAVPLAARVRPHFVDGPAPDAERDRRDLRGREHVPVEGPQPRGRGLPAALGPARARLPGHHARPLAHRGLRAPTRCGWSRRSGDRLRHVHLADGSGSNKDEHLVPGRGGQPCAEVLERLARGGYDGHRRARGQHPPGRQPGRARGRPRGGARVRPAQPRGGRRRRRPVRDRPPALRRRRGRLRRLPARLPGAAVRRAGVGDGAAAAVVGRLRRRRRNRHLVARHRRPRRDGDRGRPGSRACCGCCASRSTSRVLPVVGDGNALPLADGRFDLVSYAQSFHWTDPDLAIGEAFRVLKPGGVLATWWNRHDLSVPWFARHQQRLFAACGWAGHDDEAWVARAARRAALAATGGDRRDPLEPADVGGRLRPQHHDQVLRVRARRPGRRTWSPPRSTSSRREHPGGYLDEPFSTYAVMARR